MCPILLFRFKFKARPLNPKIFQPGYQGLCGVVREEVRAPTIPVAPRLATAEREAKRKQSEQAQDQTGFVFKALDPPKGMFEGVKVPCLLVTLRNVPVVSCVCAL